jgi:hypothetical protein
LRLFFLLYIISLAKLQLARRDFGELSNIFGTLDKRHITIDPRIQWNVSTYPREVIMNTHPLITLAEQADSALCLWLSTDGHGRADRISEISECNRRATSALADFHADQFRVFLPPLPRAAATDLAEALYACMDAVFCTALLTRGRLPSPSENRSAEYRSLSRMSRLLRETVTSLSHVARGKSPTPPDTFLFYKELGLSRAAHTVEVLHGERTLYDRALNESLGTLAHALLDAHRAALVLMMECV